jgi:hypothetical protein
VTIPGEGGIYQALLVGIMYADTDFVRSILDLSR